MRRRAFYEALGFRFEHDMDIVRDGELEATNYFFGIGDQDSVLELTFITTASLRRSASWPNRASSPSASRTASARAARSSASSATGTVTQQH
jgi:hypothetical protein